MNSILTIYPYKFYGQWVFDDPLTGLIREALISGIDTMLDQLSKNIEDAEFGMILLFSETAFPGHQIRLDWVRTESGGNWYWCEQYQIEGWLCPALYKYFEVAPTTIFAQAKAKS